MGEYTELVVVSGKPAGEVYDREARLASTQEDADALCQHFETEAKAAGLWENWVGGPHIYEIDEDEVMDFITYRTGQIED